MAARVLLILVLGGLLAGAAAFAVRAWIAMGDVEMSIHGWIALGLGAGLSLALGAGLMALSFHSHRHGHDDIHPPEA